MVTTSTLLIFLLLQLLLVCFPYWWIHGKLVIHRLAKFSWQLQKCVFHYTSLQCLNVYVCDSMNSNLLPVQTQWYNSWCCNRNTTTLNSTSVIMYSHVFNKNATKANVLPILSGIIGRGNCPKSDQMLIIMKKAYVYIFVQTCMGILHISS